MGARTCSSSVDRPARFGLGAFLLAFQAPALAAIAVFTVPNGLETTEGDSSSALPFGDATACANGFRYQQIFNGDQGIFGTIGNIAFRLDGGESSIGPLTLQNAVITKLSGARIRTTHVTGMATDLGIELGKGAWRLAALLGRPAPTAHPPVRPDVEKLRTHGELIFLFFASGLLGAVAFQRLGAAAALPLAAIVAAFAAGPLWEDLSRRA